MLSGDATQDFSAVFAFAVVDDGDESASAEFLFLPDIDSSRTL